MTTGLTQWENRCFPVDWNITLVKLIGFAVLSLIVGTTITARKLRRLG
jgi:hypothetical protein